MDLHPYPEIRYNENCDHPAPEPLRPLVEDARQRNSAFKLLRPPCGMRFRAATHAARQASFLSDLKKTVAPGLVWGLEEATNNPEATGSRRTGTRSLR